MSRTDVRIAGSGGDPNALTSHYLTNGYEILVSARIEDHACRLVVDIDV